MLIILLLFIQISSVIFLLNQKNIQSISFDNTVTLNQYEYHIVSVNASKGELISGDWQVFPADIVFSPFLFS